MRQKYMPTNFNLGVKSMLITKNLIKFNKLIVKIPGETKRVWDTAENRWGFKFLRKKR